MDVFYGFNFLVKKQGVFSRTRKVEGGIGWCRGMSKGLGGGILEAAEQEG